MRAALLSSLVGAAVLAGGCGGGDAATSKPSQLSGLIVLNHSIGGVALGATQVHVERLLGGNGRRGPTQTSTVRGAFDVDYTSARVRITYAPCARGACVVAAATSSPRYRTRPGGFHVGGSGSLLPAMFVRAHFGFGSGPVGRTDAATPNFELWCGFASSSKELGPRTGTVFLEKLRRDGTSTITTIAVAEPTTSWNGNRP